MYALTETSVAPRGRRYSRDTHLPREPARHHCVWLKLALDHIQLHIWQPPVLGLSSAQWEALNHTTALVESAIE